MNKTTTKKYFEIYIDLEKAKSQNKIIIEGVEIYFPFKPYPPQEEYMKKVILTLSTQGNISTLESPTGTGKTLCLLCSVLGWLRKNKEKEIDIYYCTRTISQIKNIMKELNKTCYILNNSFLVSRKYTCPYYTKSERDTNDISRLNELCKKNKKDHLCKYYRDPQDYELNKYNNLKDIEDLFKYGKKKMFCPYFFNKKKTQELANLTFTSYNYILNPFIRNRIKLSTKNSIIILDEAHNIYNIFENLFSKKIKKTDLEKTQAFLQLIMDNNNTAFDGIFEEKSEIFYIKNTDINKEINVIKNVLNNIQNLKPENNNSCQQVDDKINKNCYICKKEFFKSIFKEFNYDFYKKITKYICKLNEEEENKLSDYYNKRNYKVNKDNFKSIIKKPKKIYEFLKQINNFNDLDNSDDSNDSEDDNSNNKLNNINDSNNSENDISYKYIFSNEIENVFFEIYCVDASIGMNNLLETKPYSIILTSGTLSINMLKNLLQINIKEELNNNHVVKNKQFLINIISSFQINNTKSNFSFSFKNRDKGTQIIQLGNEIYNLVNSVKEGGILVFFQSYEYLNKCHTIWLDKEIIKKLEKLKKTIFDLNITKNKNEEDIIKAKKEKNLLLFTVYRGKNSEGINFPNDEARMVICVGIPYPNLSDIKVKIKMDFLDEKYEKECEGLKGWQWYSEEAMVAVNQSLGRVIRNKDDYGIMICFGIEFIIKKNLLLFSKWIKDNISIVELKENNEEYYNKIEKFLDNLKLIYNYSNISNNSSNSQEFIEEEEEEEVEKENIIFIGNKRRKNNY